MAKRTKSAVVPSVDSFLDELDHPLKQAIQAVRSAIVGVSDTIEEGIKWNSPSFRTSDWFATVNLRCRGGEERVWLILHTGAKTKAGAKGTSIVDDPAGLLEWLGPDRAMIKFTDLADVRAKRKALEGIVRQWVKLL
jgi:hypothetical protein